MRQLLLSEKWRPKNMGDVILLPRIRKIFEEAPNQNYLLYGHFGTGKTTLARIIIGKYAKTNPYLELNSSFYTSIDILRSKIDDFCSKVHMGFDLEVETDKDVIKWVFLDEFERTSTQYQDALKAYIEEYSTKNVRFVLTTNHINKVSPGIRSRLIEIDFDCQNPEEERFLKVEIYKKISSVIAPKENFQIGKEELVKIINKKFPDFRSIMIDVDNYRLTGGVVSNLGNIDTKIKSELYNLLFDKSQNYDSIYHFLMNNFGPEKIDQLFDLLGRQFVEWFIAEKKGDVNKLFAINFIITDYSKFLETSTDPIILGMTVVGKTRDILK